MSIILSFILESSKIDHKRLVKLKLKRCLNNHCGKV